MDEKNWSSGLEESEKAALAMPRPTHPLVLKYRALFKVNLGISPNGDMAKLERAEKEDVVSDMWHRVAMSSSNREEQLYALQQSIMLLQNPDMRVKKIEAITRFGDWLFVHQYPVKDVLDQLEWVLDIAVGLKSDNKGTVLMPIDEQDESRRPRSLAHTQSVTRTRQTVSTQQASLPDEKIEILSKPKPLLCYVDELMERVEEIADVQRGELIARTLVIRSKMVLYSGGNVKESMFLAYSIYKQVLQTCLMNLEGGGATEEKPGTREGKRGKGDAKGNTKLSSKSQLQFTLPDSLVEWSVFRLPSNTGELLKDRFDSCTVNKLTFPRPELSLIYIDELCRQFELFGLIDYLLPLYALQDLLAVSLLNNPHLSSLIHHKAAWNCQQLQLLQGFNLHMEIASAVSTDSEFVDSIVDLDLYKAKLKTSVSLPTGLPEDTPAAYSVISRISLHDIQVQKAEILIKSGDFKTAITLLDQAVKGIELCSDKKSRESYIFAASLLAATQANHDIALDQLTALLSEVNNLDIATSAMVKLLEILLAKDVKTAEEVSERFIGLLWTFHEHQKNHSCQIQYTISKIQSMVIQSKTDQLFEGTLTTLEIETLLELCKRYDKIILVFINLGFTLDAAWSMYWLSKVKFRLSILENDTDFHKCMFLEGIEGSLEAAKILNIEVDNLMKLGVRQTKLPRFFDCLIHIHCHLSNMYHEISTDVMATERRFRIADSQKDVIDKEIECYISEPVLLSTLEDRWQRLTYSSAELCKVHGDNAVRLCDRHHLLYSCPSQQILGTALADLSQALYEDSLDVWTCHLTGEEITTRSIQEEVLSLKYLSSSIELLTQAVQISLLKQDHPALQSACQEVLSRLGHASPQISVQYLCLLQSSMAAVWLKQLIKRALQWPSKSEIGSLISQLDQAYKAGNYQLYNQCFEQLLKTNSSWKRLLVFENHFDMLREIDEKQYFIVLQHSPCKKYLYSALLQGCKTAGKAPLESPLIRISRHSVTFGKLESIQRMYENYKREVHRYMIKMVHFFKLQTQTEQRKVLLDQLGVVEGDQVVGEVKQQLDGEKERNDKFYHTIVSQLWEYIKDAVEAFIEDFKLIVDPEASFILLADVLLQNLPLEALPISKIGAVKHYTRDFSLQTHYHRLLSYTHSKNSEQAAAPDTKKGAKTPIGSAKGERTKNMLDKRLYLDKVVLLPPVVDSNNFKYIVNDTSLKCGEVNMTAEISEMLKVTQAKTARWTGTLVTDSQCSPVTVQELLHQSSGVMFCGLGKITALISSELLTCLNLTNSHLHIISDKVVSAHSLRHEKMCDGKKGTKILALETTLQLAGLLYLNGSVLSLINSDECSSDNNIAFVSSLIKTAVDKDLPLGTALYLTRYPAPPDTTPTQPATPIGKGKAKPPKTKDPTQDSAILSTIQITMPPSLDPNIYNLAAFGVPSVTLGEPSPVPGKK